MRSSTSRDGHCASMTEPLAEDFLMFCFTGLRHYAQEESNNLKVM
jgi:hypothetical protein